MRSQTEQLASSVLYLAYSLPKYSGAADVVVRAQRQPGGEMSGRRPLGKIAADLTKQRQRVSFHLGNLGHVQPEQLVGFAAEIESTFRVAVFLPPLWAAAIALAIAR